MIVILVTFLFVYLGMFLGGFPGLRVDRTGIALLGAIGLIAAGHVSLEEAVEFVDLPTMGLLFAMMVLSAQIRLGGGYSALTRWVSGRGLSPGARLAVFIVTAGLLSAVFTNDILAMAMTPVVIDVSRAEGRPATPYLLAVAGAANVGSAATLIGNPQNILIGQALQVPFGSFAATAVLTAALGLGLTWLIVHARYRGELSSSPGASALQADGLDPDHPFDGKSVAYGAALVVTLIALFLTSSIPREVAALGAAGLVLASRKYHTREMLELVDWHMLVLFGGLFVVNGAFVDAGLLERGMNFVRSLGLDPSDPGTLFLTSAFLSPIVSNVPAVMLLIPAADGLTDALALATASTYAGNLIIPASIANIIVIESARRQGVAIGWREHARVGLPLTALTLAVAAALVL